MTRETVSGRTIIPGKERGLTEAKVCSEEERTQGYHFIVGKERKTCANKSGLNSLGESWEKTLGRGMRESVRQGKLKKKEGTKERGRSSRRWARDPQRRKKTILPVQKKRSFTE